MDAMPSTDLRLDTRGIPDYGTGTDASAAIELALASMSPDTMHRIVLLHDGNNTSGSRRCGYRDRGEPACADRRDAVEV